MNIRKGNKNIISTEFSVMFALYTCSIPKHETVRGYVKAGYQILDPSEANALECHSLGRNDV